jgi:hypothetical protein
MRFTLIAHAPEDYAAALAEARAEASR